MNTAKFLAILFAFFSFSATRETLQIMASEDKDFAPIAVILTAGFVLATIFFWKKSKRTKF